MRLFTLITLIVIHFLSFGQNIENKDYSSNLLKDSYIHDKLDKSNNLLDDFKNKDLSSIWTFENERDFNGIIGTNHQRIQIYFSKVKKVDKFNNTYELIGKSKVKTNICNFKGKLTFTNIYKLFYQDFESNGITEYVAIGDYIFYENSSLYGSGIFKGKFATLIYVDKSNKVHYDDIKRTASGYTNNYFVGTWKSYKTSALKICNWGDSKIPFTNKDFDIGEGEMYIYKKYHSKGWKSYMDAYLKNENALKIENKQWWK